MNPQRFVTSTPASTHIKVTLKIDGQNTRQFLVNRFEDGPIDTLSLLKKDNVGLPQIYDVSIVTSNATIIISQDNLKDLYSDIVTTKVSEFDMIITSSKNPNTALSEYFLSQIKTEKEIVPDLKENQAYYNWQTVTIEDNGDIVYEIPKIYLKLKLLKKDAKANKFIVQNYEIAQQKKHNGITVVFLRNVQKIIVYWSRDQVSKIEIDQA